MKEKTEDIAPNDGNIKRITTIKIKIKQNDHRMSERASFVLICETFYYTGY